MLEEQRAPGLIGASVMVKAVDATAEIVMQDYKLTDLKDNVRAGESIAPKLPPAQQALADGMFGGGTHGLQVKDPQTGQVRSLQAERMNRLGQRAIAGHFRASAVPPNAIIPARACGRKRRCGWCGRRSFSDDSGNQTKDSVLLGVDCWRRSRAGRGMHC